MDWWMRDILVIHSHRATRTGLDRVWQRLDRILVNTTFHNIFPALKVHHLARDASDHAPLSVTFEQDQQQARGRFIFQRMWADHPSFLEVVRKAWDTPTSGSASNAFHTKLMNVRKTLKNWNWDTFGDIQWNIKESQEKIQVLENILVQGWSEDTQKQLVELKQHLLKLEQWEAELLSNKARIAWEKDGDRNTAFFHASMKDRRKKSLIHVARQNGTITTSQQEIGLIAESFFLDLFKASEYYLHDELFQNTPQIVTDGINGIFAKYQKRGRFLKQLSR
ncbi:PREDICTED: uncharacterized protein LOC105973895 [Erythranthe guttata]|uniref:uncharacterized protein LOC105973895 n=1 Tax=Erythranthe guttata TaxID=4155 RepID=UPI00064DDF7C|nr:PREDICTED: uncharacterized protein LOC105973895 [Erythranthe guttata]|eukprot:XP_012854391.1 PREDICTED: uncharacterized protein LOC105973895 [Erythranthe guttata]